MAVVKVEIDTGSMSEENVKALMFELHEFLDDLNPKITTEDS